MRSSLAALLVVAVGGGPVRLGLPSGSPGAIGDPGSFFVVEDFASTR